MPTQHTGSSRHFPAPLAQQIRKLRANESRPTKTGESVRVGLHIDNESAPRPLDNSARYSLKDGDHISIQVRNPCPFPIDVTLLYIDSQQGIAALYPHRGEINRLLAGNSITIPTRVAGDKPGLERLVAIAVKSEREVKSFTCLTQTGINKTRSPADNATLKGPLGQLLNHAILSGGAVRGMKQSSVKAHCLKLISLDVQTQK